jgi:hypothetical protein
MMGAGLQQLASIKTRLYYYYYYYYYYYSMKLLDYWENLLGCFVLDGVKVRGWDVSNKKWVDDQGRYRQW